MEIFAQNLPKSTKEKSNEAYYSFVAIDSESKPIPVPVLIPETDKEKRLYEDALRRRELRLILGGKLKPEHAKNLKSLVEAFQKSTDSKP